MHCIPPTTKHFSLTEMNKHTTPGNQTELAHTTASHGFSSFEGTSLGKLISEHGMEFEMQCGAFPRGLAASAASFLIPSRLHIGLSALICSLHGVVRTCSCSLWILFIRLRLFSETGWHPLQFGASKTI